MAKQHLLDVGKITGVFGVKGWLKVFSDTSPKENILNYSPWHLSKGKDKKVLRVVNGQLHGRSVIVQLEGINTREEAALLCGWDISIDYDQLPESEEGEYYWADLVGLKVRTVEGVELGIVDHLIETGANDVLVIEGERERLIPFLQGQVVVDIDLEAGLMIVDWDPEF